MKFANNEKMDSNHKKYSFNDVLYQLKEYGYTNSARGTIFEEFCENILKKSNFFKDDVDQVWYWKDFPGNNYLHDNGIDLVVHTKNDEYWAIQCKFYDFESTISKSDIDTFISATTRKFKIDNKTYDYAKKYVFSTTEKITDNSKGLDFTLFGPEQIENCGIDWSNYNFDKIDEMKASNKKIPRPHQEKAINDVLKGFENNDRGKLIMACGTGKTFTSLKIVEQYIQKNKIENANILYFVPSIPLLAQTIMEWKNQFSLSNGCDMFAICSDASVNSKAKSKKNLDEIVVSMPIPATTDAKKLIDEYSKYKDNKRVHFFFSTYQSIDIANKVMIGCNIKFDFVICDEAHRTIGAYNTNNPEYSNFTKVHDQSFIKANKRLYMTATEKIYSSSAKTKAKSEGWDVYSMDDESVYGPIFYYLSFAEAVSQQLLTDYKLIVLDIKKSMIANLNLKHNLSENLDEISKVFGSLSALSKITSENCKDEFINDPNPMRQAIVFTTTINEAERFSERYNQLAKDSVYGTNYLKEHNFVIPKSKLITGNDSTYEKNKKLKWLKDDIPNGECHILTNARCLSEGVDIPSLDAVIFMTKKKSQVDIIQAVGRVMRKFSSSNEKKYGYIIIPIVINDKSLIDNELSNNEDYKVVWQIVQALRSHDDRLDKEINRSSLTEKLPSCICQINSFIQPCKSKDAPKDFSNAEEIEGFDIDDNFVCKSNLKLPSLDELKRNENLFLAQLVKNCGNRLYWEDWSRNIGDVTNNIALKIQSKIENSPKTKAAFLDFKNNLCSLINPNINESDCINMLAEHIVTLPVIKSIFNDNHQLIEKNDVSIIMQKMVDKLDNFDNEINDLQKFYESVDNNIKDIEGSGNKQKLIKELFEKFFKYALPKSAEEFGIVYTPIEVVDFIINSVNDVLKDEFSHSLISRDIKILDPFTGTGTFIVRLLEKLKELNISPEDLEYKYQNDIWCNEIMLLSYYISLINIENIYFELNKDIKPFEHVVLTDTFQLAEKRSNNFYQKQIFEDKEFGNVHNKAKEEDALDIRVIIGNPPYRSGSDVMKNNANKKYEFLDKRIEQTYLKIKQCNRLSSVYDSYIRAFRWASDRIGDDGVISFISNGSYIDGLAFAGFRKSLLEEFNKIYIFNLKGNTRNSMKTKNKDEGENVFGNGSQCTICIIVLIKQRNKPFDNYINYKEIDDCLTTQQKLERIKSLNSIKNIEWEQIYLDEHNDWLNKRDDSYSKLLLLGNKKNNSNDEITIFSSHYSRGICTGRDAWLYNFDVDNLYTNITKFKNFYETQQNKLKNKIFNQPSKKQMEIVNKEVDRDSTQIKWDDSLINKLIKNEKLVLNKDLIESVNYRPFSKNNIYKSYDLIQRIYRNQNLFPNYISDNKIIVIPGLGNKGKFSTLASNRIVDLGLISACQCFPLYWYEKNDQHQQSQQNLFANENQNNQEYIRYDAISDEALKMFQNKYSDPTITKWNIYIYIYIQYSIMMNIKQNMQKILLRKCQEFHSWKISMRYLVLVSN